MSGTLDLVKKNAPATPTVANLTRFQHVFAIVGPTCFFAAGENDEELSNKRTIKVVGSERGAMMTRLKQWVKRH